MANFFKYKIDLELPRKQLENISLSSQITFYTFLLHHDVEAKI